MAGWVEGPTFGLSQQADEAGGSLTLETQGRAESSGDNAGTGRHRRRSGSGCRQRVKIGPADSIEPPDGGRVELLVALDQLLTADSLLLQTMGLQRRAVAQQ